MQIKTNNFSIYNLKLLDDDSDTDLVTDYLCLATNKNGSETKAININKPPKSAFTTSSTYEHNKMYNNNNNNINNNINMVPTISVTPHSPGTKYNSILGWCTTLFFVVLINNFLF